ncbi:MAG: leucine-rich repeat domain-containing protein, partial [Firmicutes bacterium]|nr:leucine-rich repeat domain-containing protein [Bacillota bacterium]
AEQKAEKILKLKKPPLLILDPFGYGSVQSVSDIEIRKVELSDFLYTKEDGTTDYVFSIGPCAFANCRNLESVELPASLYAIYRNAFYGCTALKSINLENVGSIGEDAFSQCKNLRSVVLSKKLESISDGVFASSGLTHIDIPKKVAKIGDRAFAGTCLEKIRIPDSVTEIGKAAFEYCEKLKEISVGAGMILLDFSIFDFCYCVEEISIGKNVSLIPDLTYIYNLKNLKKLKVDKDNKTFRIVNNCLIDVPEKRLIMALKNAVIPSDGSVTTLRTSALVDLSLYKNGELFIPRCIENIGRAIHKRCGKITVEEGNKKYRSEGDCLIETASRKIIMGCGNSVIPADGSVTVIGSHAFSNVSGAQGEWVDYLEIPSCIEEIEESAFEHAHILQYLIYGNGLKKVGRDAFSGGGKQWLSITDLNNFVQIDFADRYGASPASDVKVYVNNELLDTFIINDETPPVNEYAFGDCLSIKKIAVLKFFETEVSLKAFRDCSKIKEILVPEGVTVTDIEELPTRLVKKIKYLSYEEISAKLYE